MALTGLTPNTRYYYRVTSTDAAGNTTVAPATSGAPAAYVPSVAPVVHSTVADFSTGSGGYVADTSGGEVMSTPAVGSEFPGAAIPSGWTSDALVTGGTTTVSGGSATVSGKPSADDVGVVRRPQPQSDTRAQARAVGGLGLDRQPVDGCDRVIRPGSQR